MLAKNSSLKFNKSIAEIAKKRSIADGGALNFSYRIFFLFNIREQDFEEGYLQKTKLELKALFFISDDVF